MTIKPFLWSTSVYLAVARAKALAIRDDTFDWASLAPSTNLSWAPCYDALQCARFTVPLQYSDPSVGEAQIAVIMSPSNLSHSDPSYLGPLLVNPGGPGGSGIDLVLTNGDLLRTIAGPQFDIVSFDPRGVGETTPPLNFFASPEEALFFHEAYPSDANESVSSFGRALTQSQILAKLAVDRVELVAESVGTPAVATDMLNIAKAFGQDKLNYYGLSYGSLLGSTFAAMFPNNVGRFIIDGVINAHDWYAGNTTNFLISTDDALTSIYDACVAAGPQLCPIFANSSDLIRDRVNGILDSVHVEPLAAINDTDPTNIQWEVVDYTTLKGLLLTLLYSPYDDALAFAEGVLALEQGDTGIILELTGSPLPDICPANASQPFDDGDFGTKTAVWFGDSLADGNRTFAQAKANYDAALNLSEFATLWYPINQAGFTSWNIKAKDRLNGTFITNTSTPILLIGNTFDPVTPLASAHNMSAGFTGSAVLQQNSTGHTSLSGFNLCTAQVIQQYLTNLTLPDSGTVCQPDAGIWSPPSNSSSLAARSTDVAAREPLSLDEAVQALARSSIVKRSMALGPKARRTVA
ncbi:hypothetical protein PHLGIDRAFT_115450 [Phlebiopsis gigantea 11061_1 CR5-6]|uniref:AB hydrolase-1 domain-containing protein n=1 Tax=Phlebiopsis gigantea (strain 11061_1 CR5-6) TaxID=745531 RepID=A0A0C3SC10_PHLG1|nr:hypothetical protein PHLGIDRAFT_115450 [Phlebiopsis gigantea 11061_1 CR5-6]